MARTKKAKALPKAARALATKPGHKARSGGNKEERRLRKLKQRRRDKARITPGQWAEPAPAHLVGKLNVPKVKSKYQSYFEFAENTEKKKKLEFQASVLVFSKVRTYISRLRTTPIHHLASRLCLSGTRT